MSRTFALLVLSIVGACGPSTASVDTAASPVAAGVVATEGGVVALPNPRLRYPSGAQVVRLDDDSTRTVLSEGLEAAGAPFVHHEGERILFVAREPAEKKRPFCVYECAADGSDRRIVVDHGTDCIRAAYLPDGRIVYAAALPGVSPISVEVPRTAVFVADGQGGAGERITFGAGVDTDPTVLSDGRVLFSSWRPAESGGGRLGLFTIHPDGTGYAPFHLADGHAVYPTQQGDLDVRFVLTQDHDPWQERVADWDAPLAAADRERSGPARGETRTLAPRPRPQGYLSSVKADRPYGTLVCVDARSNGAAAATSYQIATWSGERTVLGRAPLAADGSFMVQVPPNTPLVIQLFDADGTLVREEHGPIWVRHNEARVCVGCHDDIQMSPPNRRPLAVLEEPVDMTGVDR